jgi:hypothetical protein
VRVRRSRHASLVCIQPDAAIVSERTCTTSLSFTLPFSPGALRKCQAEGYPGRKDRLDGGKQRTASSIHDQHVPVRVVPVIDCLQSRFHVVRPTLLADCFIESPLCAVCFEADICRRQQTASTRVLRLLRATTTPRYGRDLKRLHTFWRFVTGAVCCPASPLP